MLIEKENRKRKLMDVVSENFEEFEAFLAKKKKKLQYEIHFCFTSRFHLV
jgi:hypothetical protein